MTILILVMMVCLFRVCIGHIRTAAGNIRLRSKSFFSLRKGWWRHCSSYYDQL